MGFCEWTPTKKTRKVKKFSFRKLRFVEVKQRQYEYSSYEDSVYPASGLWTEYKWVTNGLG